MYLDRKTLNQLKTDVIHVQSDLMLPEERSRKIAHIVKFACGVFKSVKDTFSEEENLENLNNVLGINKSHTRISKKEASSIINDILNVKHSNMSNQVKMNAISKISSYIKKYADPAALSSPPSAGGLRGPQIKPNTIPNNPAESVPPNKPDQKPSEKNALAEILKSLKSGKIPENRLLELMTPVAGRNKILVEISPGEEVSVNRELIQDYIGDIISANKSKTVEILSPKVVQILGLKGLLEQINKAYSSDPMEFLPVFEDLRNKGAIKKDESVKLLTFIMSDEFSEPRKAFLFLKKLKIRHPELKNSLRVLLFTSRAKWSKYEDEYWDKILKVSDEEDEIEYKGETRKLAPEEKTKEPEDKKDNTTVLPLGKLPEGEKTTVQPVGKLPQKEKTTVQPVGKIPQKEKTTVLPLGKLPEQEEEELVEQGTIKPKAEELRDVVKFIRDTAKSSPDGIGGAVSEIRDHVKWLSDSYGVKKTHQFLKDLNSQLYKTNPESAKHNDTVLDKWLSLNSGN